AGTRHGEKVPKLVPSVILLIDDPFTVGRPDTTILPLVRLYELNGPSPCRTDLPEVLAAGHIRCERNLLSIRRPRSAANRPGKVQVVNGQRARIRIAWRGDGAGIGALPVPRTRRLGKRCKGGKGNKQDASYGAERRPPHFVPPGKTAQGLGSS